MLKMDIPLITGGNRQTKYGGMMILYLILATVLYMYRWVIFMQHPTYSLDENPLLTNTYVITWNHTKGYLKWDTSFENTYKVILIVFTSRLQSSDDLYENVNLCDENIYQIELSEYFNGTEKLDTVCSAISLTNQNNSKASTNQTTDMNYFKFRYEITLNKVKKSSKNFKDEYIHFKLNTDKNQIYHFYDFQFFSIWDTNVAVMNDALMRNYNSTSKQPDKAFIGSEPIVEVFELLPVFWENM